MHVFMQIRVHKNAAYFATSPAYFDFVRVAFFFLLFGRVFSGGLIDIWVKTLSYQSIYNVTLIKQKTQTF